MKKTLIALMALAGVAAADSITLTMPATNNNGGHGYIAVADAITAFANQEDGGYMFNTGGTVNPDTSFNEGLLMTDVSTSVTSLTMAPRTGAGGSGEVILLSGTELIGQEVNSLTFTIDSSTCSKEGSVALTLAVIQKNDQNEWGITEQANSTLTLNSGASLILNLTDSIAWSESYKVVAMVDNAARTLAGGNSPTYTLSGISVAANVASAVPEPTTATLSLLALVGLAARRRRK